MTDQDPFSGQGGSYVVDKTGKRIRVEETTDHPEGNRAREIESAPEANLIEQATPSTEV